MKSRKMPTDDTFPTATKKPPWDNDSHRGCMLGWPSCFLMTPKQSILKFDPDLHSI